MTKAIKTLAIVSVFALVISAFTACSLSSSDSGETTTTEPETTEQTEMTTAEPAEYDITVPVSEAQEDQETIEDIFTDIKNFEVGTAGSSVKAAGIALRLIAFSNSSLAESENLSSDVKSLVESIGSDQADDYEEALYQINSYAKNFFDGKQSEVVSSSNVSDFSLDKDYSQEKYEKVYELLNK